MVPRHGYADVSIGQLHYTQAHHAGGTAGTLLLLNSRARSSLRLFPHLGAYARLVSIELPAFGMSSPMKPGCTMNDIASVVAECLAVLDIGSADVFSLHSGHKVAAALAAERPELVRRLLIGGRTHSIIPEHQRRNGAMKRTIDENHPDIALLKMEGKFIDDFGGPAAFAAIFEANFNFDFAAAMRRIEAPTTILEITSAMEDGLYGRQAERLAEGMKDVSTVSAAQREPTGVELYIGVEPMADILLQSFGLAGLRHDAADEAALRA